MQRLDEIVFNIIYTSQMSLNVKNNATLLISPEDCQLVSAANISDWTSRGSDEHEKKNVE